MCPERGVLGEGMADQYDPVTELPFTNHEPHQCRCTNDLKLYKRKGRLMMFCSICWMPGDKEVLQ